MLGSVRFKSLIERIYRQTLHWRTARVFCAVWFALTAIGFPGSLSRFGGSGCATNPGQQCHCSLTKRMSGTCCCSRNSKPQVAKSCCAAKQAAPKLTQAGAACCSSKATASTVAVTTPKAELSIARCDCGSDSPESVSLAQEPRLPATVATVSLPETSAVLAVLPANRVESVLLLPPVPPPKVVL